MKSSVQLESVVFHLTPTRTRCDLIIIANGKKEKIASGLLHPFLAHLKSAQDQIAKGGYSIFLEPHCESTISWFTKGTVERFVRFVSTPDILERANIIESEIIQIEETIAIQGKNHIQHGLESIPCNKSKAVVNDDKAVVLYKPEEHQPETTGSFSPDGNSREQVLKILEARKSALEKEQCMAFARAIAAGFHVDDMPLLLSFGKCFGASRLREACLRFMELWKKKSEFGKRLEIGAVEAVDNSLRYLSDMNPPGIMFSNVSHSNIEMASESNEKLITECTAGEMPPMDHHVRKGQQENLQGQFSSWSMESPVPAQPLLQPYHVQGVPYYSTYSQNNHFYPPYSVEDPQMGVMQRFRQKRQSAYEKNSQTASFLDNSLWDYEDPQYQKQMKIEGWSENGQPRKIVTQNIGYISKTNSFTSKNSESASEAESNVDTEDLLDSYLQLQNEVSLSSKAKGSNSNLYDNHGKVNKAEIDGGHWLAFQNILFGESHEDNCSEKDHIFVMEKGPRRQNSPTGEDHTALVDDNRESDIHGISIDLPFCIPSISSNKDLHSHENWSNDMGPNDQLDLYYAETNGKKSINTLTENGLRAVTNKLVKTSSQNMVDESFVVVPIRSMLFNDTVPNYITTFDMDYELPTTTRNTGNNSNGVKIQTVYEPSDLSLMPKRETETSSSGYNATVDYEIQAHFEDGASWEEWKKEKKEASTIMKEVRKKLEKDQRAKADLDSKKTVGAIRRGKVAKTSHVNGAQVHVESLRSCKPDIEKMKKEKEEADIKRVEALKSVRQNRTAARGTLNSSHLVAPQSQKRRVPTKVSPTPVRWSKFSDSEPGSSSPLQRSKLRTPLLSTNSPEDSKSHKFSEGLLRNNLLKKSAPSWADPTKESSISATPNSKAYMARLRRLSEPKIVNWPVASVKAHSPGTVSKAKIHSSETVMKPNKSGQPENSKISVIMDIDTRKGATLPELRVLKGLSENVNDSRPPLNSEDVKSFTDDENFSRDCDGDENIVEKNVVMLEYESSSLPVAPSEDNIGVCDQQYDSHGIRAKSSLACEHASIDAPPSPFVGFVRNPILGSSKGQPNSPEVLPVGTSYAYETSKFANTDPGGKPYEASRAHITSLEEPCTVNLEYHKAPLAINDLGSAEPVKAHAEVVTAVGEYELRDSSAKVQVKESLRGIRRLWKFGKKNESGSECDKTLEPDHKSFNGLKQDDHAACTTSLSEVYTLKSLMSQDETSASDNDVQKSEHKCCTCLS
ncbi:hypothetical protein DM860_001677 [Cuscuta australis]|uniref:COP1-interacting protein 7 n=1 Tax=Cuscuta australis TaxID=267555 RepID=A0A328ED75_9ASTE|nr:hypothetical protein DM860_001677 [Cuscuta australis]